ncbi:hypothetical protein M427DRAFT_259065 [Gonapodya prolifera JEL478]|uniref:Uncharacterized protein n=1 Tax=Gonapodya prolifera (strain JEL478) TaxID=1344416 RepID=A0A139ALI4_GONPJ|nr:hypothetical protein M427DRAFT_259065 [Gonapodya prolifera JEL478]|eukprot:KXS17295.1 hypothetical protein M427DRAFT_259065 [Gonapodya prolifera JEL478]
MSRRSSTSPTRPCKIAIARALCPLTFALFPIKSTSSIVYLRLQCHSLPRVGARIKLPTSPARPASTASISRALSAAAMRRCLREQKAELLHKY